MVERNLIEQLADAYKRYCPEKVWDLERRLLSDPFRSAIQSRRHLSRANDEGEDEFLMIVQWKSPRPRAYADLNPGDLIEVVSKEAFRLADMELSGLAVQLLDYLSGVNARMASAILMVYDPDRFTVMDVFAWEALTFAELWAGMSLEPGGDLDRASVYEVYLTHCRQIARTSEVSLRALDRCLWMIGKYGLNSTDEIHRWLAQAR